jgi:hypothetical protein
LIVEEEEEVEEVVVVCVGGGGGETRDTKDTRKLKAMSKHMPTTTRGDGVKSHV